MNRSCKSDRKYTPYACVHIEVHHFVSRTDSMCSAQSVDIWRLCGQMSHFPSILVFCEATFFLVHIEFSCKFRCSWSSVATSLLELTSRNASLCHPSELDGASRMNYLASGFPVLDQSFRQGAVSISGLFDAVGFCTVEELVETSETKFIVGFDFCPRSFLLPVLASLSPSFLCSWSCWISESNKVSCNGGCFHKWNCLLVNMSASWCLVSTYLIWICGPTLILSNNQSGATLWVQDTSLFDGLLHLMIILITASLFSKMSSIGPIREDFALDQTLTNITPNKNFVLGWNLGLDLGVLVFMWCYATSFLVLDLWCCWLVRWRMEHWIAKSHRSRAGNSIHA